MSNEETTIIIALLTLFGTLAAQFIPALKEWPQIIATQRAALQRDKAQQLTELERTRNAFWSLVLVANEAISFGNKVAIQCTEVGERFNDQIEKIEGDYKKVLDNYTGRNEPPK